VGFSVFFFFFFFFQENSIHGKASIVQSGQHNMKAAGVKQRGRRYARR